MRQGAEFGGSSETGGQDAQLVRRDARPTPGLRSARRRTGRCGALGEWRTTGKMPVGPTGKMPVPLVPPSESTTRSPSFSPLRTVTVPVPPSARSPLSGVRSTLRAVSRSPSTSSIPFPCRMRRIASATCFREGVDPAGNARCTSTYLIDGAPPIVSRYFTARMTYRPRSTVLNLLRR